MSNFQDISMQWLHFVNELDCYKGKESKRQLLNMIQFLCSHNIVTWKDRRYSIKKIIIAIFTTLFTEGGGGWGGGERREAGGGLLDSNPHFLKTGGPIKIQSYMSENPYKTRNLHGCLDFFYLDLHIKFFLKKCLGSSRPPPPQ